MGSTAPNKPKPDVSNYIKLNIGGSLFYTTVTTLSKLDSKLLELVLSDLEANENNCSPAQSEGMLYVRVGMLQNNE